MFVLVLYFGCFVPCFRTGRHEGVAVTSIAELPNVGTAQHLHLLQIARIVYFFFAFGRQSVRLGKARVSGKL